MHRRLTTAVLTASALLALTACSSTDAKPETTPSVDYSAAEKAAGIPAAPTGAKRTALLDALKAIDPSLVADEDKAIDHARNQCSSLNGGSAKADWSAAQRFGDDTHPLTDAQGKAINAALRATLCPKP